MERGDRKVRESREREYMSLFTNIISSVSFRHLPDKRFLQIIQNILILSPNSTASVFFLQSFGVSQKWIRKMLTRFFYLFVV